MRIPLSPRQQTGMVSVFVVVSMAGLLATMGLAIDLGRTYLARARLQHAVDAAALAGARRLAESGPAGTALAAAEGQAAFDLFADGPGNMDLQGLSVEVSFSSTANPFSGGSSGPFVRASVAGLSVSSALLRLLGPAYEALDVGASAVAGPSPMLQLACSLTPIVVCGNASLPYPWFDTSKGYNSLSYQDNPTKLKVADFYSIGLDCGTGDACVRANMAGSYPDCKDLSGGLAMADPLVAVDNSAVIAQGLNTRFNVSSGLDLGVYPPDVVIAEPNPRGLDYADYLSRVAAESYDIAPPTGQVGRRVLKVQMADCATGELLGIACLFMKQQAKQTGADRITAEFFSASPLGNACLSDGIPYYENPNPTIRGPHTIVLYRQGGAS